jgi:hypothetical protein
VKQVTKALGPYLASSGKTVGRRYMQLFYDDGSKGTTLYSRWLMEQHLGRRLTSDEHVDHVDEDKTNDDILNLAIVSSSINAKKSNALRRSVEVFALICPQCKQLAYKPAKDVRSNRKKGKKGPYCGRQCAGIASHA